MAAAAKPTDVAKATDSSETTESSSPPTSLSVPHLPEENHKKGFFPISWRVIGGGVMMGGKSTYMRPSVESDVTYLGRHQGPPCQAFLAGRCADGDDCKFSHDVDGDEEAVVAENEPQSPPPPMPSPVDHALVLNNVPPTPTRSQKHKRKHTSTQSLSITLPPDKERIDDAEPGEGSMMRPRSMCITPTSRLDYTSVSYFSVLCRA
jgi:hypothetical protein